MEHKILIGDYKTNRPAPDEVAGVPSLYLKQMRAYKRALEVIYPKHEVEAAILWTDKAQLMPLPTELIS